MKRLLEIALISNTPEFLFRTMRREPEVLRLAASTAASELLEKAIAFSRKAELDFEDRALLYAHLVATSLRPSGELRDAVESVGAPSYRWADRLLNLALASAPSDSLQFAVVTPARAAPVNTVPAASTSTISSNALWVPARVDVLKASSGAGSSSVREIRIDNG